MKESKTDNGIFKGQPEYDHGLLFGALIRLWKWLHGK
jgi:hypothetical protein